MPRVIHPVTDLTLNSFKSSVRSHSTQRKEHDLCVMQKLFLTSNCHPFLDLGAECHAPAAHVRHAEIWITCRSQSLTNPIPQLIIHAASASFKRGRYCNEYTKITE